MSIKGTARERLAGEERWRGEGDSVGDERYSYEDNNETYQLLLEKSRRMEGN
jgi:hypothetical protein